MSNGRKCPCLTRARVLRWVESNLLSLGRSLLEVVGLTAHVVGPADDTDGVEAAGAAGLVPIHPAVGQAVSGLDCRDEYGGGIGRRDVRDGRGDCEAREEGGEAQHDGGAN